MKPNETNNTDLAELVEMIGYMGRLDFSKRLKVSVDDSPVNVIAYGLNMLSEELEANMVQRSMLEEVNLNLESFSYTVAHDIRTPLNSSIGLINLIELELKSEKKTNLPEYFNILKQTLQRMSEMISNILEYSKAGFNAVEYTRLSIAEIVNTLTADYRKNVIQVNLRPGLPDIEFNKFAFSQVLGNLIGNAIKHNDKELCIVEIDCVDKDAFYEISVKDNGPGINPEHREKIFDLFNNLDSERTDSYGIGLSIVKKIVTQAKGHIWAESKENEGTIITFTIKKKINEIH